MGVGNLGDALLILFIFTMLHLFLAVAIGISSIKKNWQKNKCNPAIMPFASVFGHDPGKNLDECIKSTQVDFMSAFLEPIYKSLGFFAANGAIFTDIFEDIKVFGNAEQDSTYSLKDSIVNRVSNVVTETGYVFNDAVTSFSQLGSVITVIFRTIQGTLHTADAVNAQLPMSIVKAAS